MSNLPKTNAARLLKKGGVSFELIPYPVDPDNLAATHIAETLNEPIELVYKTLVLKGDKTGYFVCVVPGNADVDLKKAAKASGNKKAEMIPMKDLLGVTGYIRGGCTVIGMKKAYPAYLQHDCGDKEYFYISAGVRGLQLKLNPIDYQKFTGAEFADLIVDR